MRLVVEALADMSWVVVSDPVPAGATLLGSGLGRDSAIATRGETREGRIEPAYIERNFDHWRAYYEWLPRGRHVVEYTLRLNASGRFGLPPTRVRGDVCARDFCRMAPCSPGGPAMRPWFAAGLSAWLSCWLPAAVPALGVQAAPGLPNADVPTFEAVRAAHAPSDVPLLARDGTPLHTVRTDKTVRRGPWVALADISPALRQAIVFSEDRRFWDHGGVDWRAFAASAWANAWNTRTRGASTLTMQLAGLTDGELMRPAGGRT